MIRTDRQKPLNYHHLRYFYADDIFTTGRKLQETLAGHCAGRPARLTVAMTDALPKLLACRHLEPAMAMAEPLRLVLREDKADRLLADLAIHALDLVLSDAPVPATVRVHAHSPLLGESGVTIFGAPALAAAHRRGFPRSLSDAPFLAPTDNSVLRRSLDAWFAQQGVHPLIVAELVAPGFFFVDRALHLRRPPLRSAGVLIFVGRRDGTLDRALAVAQTLKDAQFFRDWRGGGCGTCGTFRPKCIVHGEVHP